MIIYHIYDNHVFIYDYIYHFILSYIREILTYAYIKTNICYNLFCNLIYFRDSFTSKLKRVSFFSLNYVV